MKRRITAAALILCLLAGCAKTDVNSVYIEPDVPADSLPQGDEAASDLTENADPADDAAVNISIARARLERQPCSESALIMLLRTEEHFSDEEAEAAAKACGADWNEQSRLAAVSLLEKEFLSREALMLRLKGQGFTASQAEYGADHSDLDEIAQALSKAKSYLEFSSFSYSGMITQLMNEGFTEQQAQSAANNCGADWYEQAVLTAKAYAGFRDFTREELIDRLIEDGFTEDQAETAVGR